MPSASTKLIVGLGNPGPSYKKTRHNIGARIVEALAQSFQLSWKESRPLCAKWAEYYECGGGVTPPSGRGDRAPTIYLAIPSCYMNESGGSVRRLVDHFKIDPKEGLLIIVDDAALPFGRLRLRKSGQDGGHKGLRSIEKELGTQAYARLRMGIASISNVGAPLVGARAGARPVPTLEEYVLTPFTKKEEKELESITERALEACKLWIAGPIEKAMDWTNRPR